MPGIWRPFKVIKLNSGPKPRTVIWLPSPFARLTDTPVIRCNDSAKLVSGNLPISSDEMASTIPEESRFISIERISEPRIPFTSITSTSDETLVSASAAIAVFNVLAAMMRDTEAASWLFLKLNVFIIALLYKILLCSNRR